MQKEYNFKFSESEVNIILAGLGKIPAELSYNMISKIYSSLSIQQASIDSIKEKEAEKIEIKNGFKKEKK